MYFLMEEVKLIKTIYTKIRLINFFNEVQHMLTSDSHQISIEEHLLENGAIDECRKVFRRELK